MGKKASWFGAVKKVFSPDSKKKKNRSKVDEVDTGTSESFEASTTIPPPQGSPPREVVKPLEQKKPVVVVDSVVEVEREVRVTGLGRLNGVEKEVAAVVKIQTAFRGYLARRALRALRGLVRLKCLIDGNSVKRQATNTLRCMQTLARVQSQIRSRRIRMSEENQALQRQLLLKREKELESLRMGDNWDDSLQSKEQIEASLSSKQEAAVRRERALAYAFSHQWKNSNKSANPLFMDPNNPHWGWSWMERWMAARPWESRTTTDRDINDSASAKSTNQSVGGDIMSSYARRESIDKPSPGAPKSTRQSPATPPFKPSLAGRGVKSASPRSSWPPPEDDTRSMASIQSERYRRHSVAGSSVRDDESVVSLASSPAVPSYMAPTKSARARTRFQSDSAEKIEEVTPEKLPLGSAKKRLSFPAADKHGVTSSPARRHSGPPKVDGTSIKSIAQSVYSEQNGSNGGSNR